jgi:putative nucleotidyltransferase with HDIG domain
MTVDVGRHIGQVRREITRKTLEVDSPIPLRTVIAEIIVNELLDQISEALERADTAALETWLEQTYERHGVLPYLSELLESTALTLMDVGAADGWLNNTGTMHRIAATIGRAIHRPRTAQMGISGESIDDIDVVINDIIARLFEKDVLTGEHSRAVSMWCLRLARKIGLGTTDTLLVQRGGLLHDIGKIATPNEVLNAPRRLTDEERLIIERHPVDGAEIMVDVPELGELLPMVRNHHERLDGKGYPDGLKGEDIPLSVRIVTVADCFNAMIGRRPYRPPLAPAVALDELIRHKVTHFDPALVEAMFGVVTDHHDRLERNGKDDLS